MLRLVSTQLFQEESLNVVALFRGTSVILLSRNFLHCGDSVKLLENLIFVLEVDLTNPLRYMRALKGNIPGLVEYFAHLLIA